MKKSKACVANTPVELAKALGLSISHAYEWQVRAELAISLKEIITTANLTHAQVAKLAKTSRTRITSILNFNLHNVSTDLLIRILAALGYGVNLSVSRLKVA